MKHDTDTYGAVAKAVKHGSWWNEAMMQARTAGERFSDDRG